MMRGGICFALLLLVSIAARAETNCVDPSSLAGSAVSITRYLDNQERDAKSDVIGIQGTGWFQSTNTIVTVEHVALAMKLSKEAWKQLTVQSSSGTLSISARIRQVIGDSKEKLAVLELQSPVPSARTATVRSLPLEPEERLLTIAYPRHEPRSVSGRFVRYATEVPLSGAALLELFDGVTPLLDETGDDLLSFGFVQIVALLDRTIDQRRLQHPQWSEGGLILRLHGAGECRVDVFDECHRRLLYAETSRSQG